MPPQLPVTKQSSFYNSVKVQLEYNGEKSLISCPAQYTDDDRAELLIKPIIIEIERKMDVKFDPKCKV